MGKKGKSYTTEFKFKVALDAIRGELTFNEISSKYGIHASQISRWKQLELDHIKSSFNNKNEKPIAEENKVITELYSKIGQLTCENEFLKKNIWK